MTLNASIGRRLLRAGIIAATFAAWPAVAQQPAPQPAAPAAASPTGPAAAPPWAQGRPEAAIGVPLAPIAPPPIPTAADKLPIEKLKALAERTVGPARISLESLTPGPGVDGSELARAF